MVREEGLTRTEAARYLETSMQNVSRWMKEAMENQQNHIQTALCKEVLLMAWRWCKWPQGA